MPHPSGSPRSVLGGNVSPSSGNGGGGPRTASANRRLEQPRRGGRTKQQKQKQPHLSMAILWRSFPVLLGLLAFLFGLSIVVTHHASKDLLLLSLERQEQEHVKETAMLSSLVGNEAMIRGRRPQESMKRKASSDFEDLNGVIVESSSSNLQEKSDAEIFHEAHYIEDEPDWKTFDKVYEDDRISELVRQYKRYRGNNNNKNNNKKFFNSSSSIYKPFVVRDLFSSNVTKDSMNAGHPILTTLRTLRSTRSFFNPICPRYKFPNLTLFPSISVVCPMNNERAGLLSLTVHSLLARTPPELLHEIIIVDDNGNAEERKEYVEDEEEIERLLELHPQKIKYIRNQVRLGCAGSRTAAIREATGEVVVVLDSHVEMYSSTWAQHLLLPILENPRTLAMQTLDIIDDLPGHGRHPAGANQNYGFVNDRFLFSYVEDRFGPSAKEQPPTREPFEIPFAPGSLFAIRREEFWRLGGYDQGLEVWGGENTELVMKVWRCGFDDPSKPAGRVVVVPCSRVGHVYRIHIKETGHWPPEIPDYLKKKTGIDAPGQWKYAGGKCDLFTRLVARNNLRIFRVWMGQNHSATKRFYYTNFGVNSTDPVDLPSEWGRMIASMDHDPEIARQEAIRDKNKCKSFDWFDRHVVYRLVGRHNPFHDSILNLPNCGGHHANSCAECPQGHGAQWCNSDCHWCNYGSNAVSEVHWKKVFANQSRYWAIDEITQCVPSNQPCRKEKPDPPKVAP